MLWLVDARVCKYVNFCMLILIKIQSVSFPWYFIPLLACSLHIFSLFAYSPLVCLFLLFPSPPPIFLSYLLIPAVFLSCSSHLLFRTFSSRLLIRPGHSWPSQLLITPARLISSLRDASALVFAAVFFASTTRTCESLAVIRGKELVRSLSNIC